LTIRNLGNNIQVVDKTPAPSLLPILRSQQQGELLALVLGDPDLELSVSDLAGRTGIPYASVHREIERAEAVGLVASRRVGRTRLIRADPSSPYYAGLSDVLTRAFGVPTLLSDALRGVAGLDRALLFGSWAARFSGEPGDRPVADIDLLVLGEPDRDALYAATAAAERRLGRPVQVTVRDERWLERGSGSFHDTVVGRPLVEIPLPAAGDRSQR
jgi:DNA-binding transcriptional ArsR family regulator